MSRMRKELSIPLIIHMIQRTGFGFLLKGGENDFVHDVYVECLAKEKHWKEDEIPLATFIATQIRNLRAEPFKTKKGKAEALATKVDMEDITPATTRDNVEDQILLEQLKKRMSKEMKYWLTNPTTPDFSSTKERRFGKVPKTLAMNYEYIGDIVGLSQSRVQTILATEKEKMRKLVCQ